MQDIALTIFGLIVLIFSTALHEVAHGLVAYYFGDQTAMRAGRLTLKPWSHIDPVGSLVLPFILFLAGSPFVFGWAKPVPVNPNNLRTRNAHAWVAAAGPLSNLLLAVISGLIIRFFGETLVPGMTLALAIVLQTNIVLMIFNLIPLPPFDGYHIVSTLFRFPERWYVWSMRYGLVFVVLAVLVFQKFINSAVVSLFGFLTGYGT